MKKLVMVVTVIVVGVFAIAACGGGAGGVSLEDNTWALVSYRGATGDMEHLFPGSLITIEFMDGELNGSAGCNHYFGSYETKGDSLTVGAMGMTEMWCEPQPLMDQEQAYLTALGEVASYQVSEGKLALANAGSEELAHFKGWIVPEGLGVDVLNNMVYESEFTQDGTAPLVYGEYREPAAPNSASEIVVMLTGPIGYGELNGEEVAAVILATSAGGSGTFMDLAVVMLEDGEPVNVALTLVGDRAQIHSVDIENDEIIVNMVTHGPDDPMCCPTQEVEARYHLEGDQLVLVSE